MAEITSDGLKKRNSTINLKMMLKQLFLSILVIAPLGIGIGYSYLSIASDPSIKLPWVSWSLDPSKSVYISWETEQNEICILNYWQEEGTIDDTVIESVEKRIHHLNLTNLIPDTKYYYNVTIDGALFGSGSFRTAPTPQTQKDFTFVMFSDSQQTFGEGHHNRIAQAIQGRDYSFAMNVGDITHDDPTGQLMNNFFTNARSYLDSIPLLPVVGNHDLDNEPNFYSYFINNISVGQFYYSFNWSNCHFTICHFAETREEDFSESQLNWLRDDLNKSMEKDFRIVVFHAPIMASSFFHYNSRLISNVLPIMKEFNVTMTVHGHEHHYERGTLENDVHLGNDIKYFVLGGGGSFSDFGMLPIPEADVIRLGPNFTQVQITSESIFLNTYTPEMILLDSYTIYK